MAIEFSQHDPCEERYVLRCKVVVKKISYVDHQSKSQSNETAPFVFLEPEINTQAQLFLTAWLPDGSDGKRNYELAVLCGHPVNRAFRGYLFNRDERHDRPYIMVATMSAEKDFIDFVNGKYPKSKWSHYMNLKSWITTKETVEVTILKASEDEKYLGGSAKPMHVSNFGAK
jgi:hypothetical protein